MPVSLSLVDWLLATCVIACAAAVQGAVGFGLALVAAPLLLLLDPGFVPGPMLASGLFLTALVAYRERAGIDFPGIGFGLLGRVPGTVLAGVLVASVSQAAFDRVFAVLVLLAVALSTLGVRVEPTRSHIAIAGAASGFMGTISAIGGPPLALLYQHAGGVVLRGTLAGFFLVGSLLSIATLAAVGRFGNRELWLALALLPGLLVGFLCSSRLARVVDRGGVRPAVLALAALSAGIVLIRTLSGA